MVGELRTRYPEWTITGLDMSRFAVTVATEKYGNNFVVGQTRMNNIENMKRPHPSVAGS